MLTKVVKKMKRVLRDYFAKGTIGGAKQSDLIQKIGFTDYFEYTKACNNYDPAVFGDWQVDYSKMMGIALGLKGKKILDVGCAAGGMAYGFSLEKADAYGCDINVPVIETSPFPIRDKLSVIETSEIAKRYSSKEFDLFHSQQVFEHLPGKEYSEKVVRALYDITTDDALGYIGLIVGDHLTEEELRKDLSIDQTHINVWPMEYWKTLFTKTGFVDVTEWLAPIIMCYQSEKNKFSFYKEYNWDQFFVSKGNVDVKEKGVSRLIHLLELQREYADVKIYEAVMADSRVNAECRSIISRYM